MTVKLDRMERDKTDASRVFSIIVDTPFEGQTKYKVPTEHGVIKSILDPRLVQTLPYLSAAMKNKVLNGQTVAEETLHQIGELQTTANTIAVRCGCKKELDKGLQMF